MMTMRPPQQGAFDCLSIVRRGFDHGCSCRQQLACAGDVLSTTGAGKEPVMADAMEPSGQDMKKETADGFVGRRRRGLVAACPVDPFVIVFEGGPSRGG